MAQKRIDELTLRSAARALSREDEWTMQQKISIEHISDAA